MVPTELATSCTMFNNAKLFRYGITQSPDSRRLGLNSGGNSSVEAGHSRRRGLP